ncbi:MAG: methyltransferase domain-containing protein [Simkaniaceae bacterium]|nr:methyltransferase domain-containing protein [Simkaniaceae bacterium]
MFIRKSHFSSLEEEYTPHYCLQLEAAYGAGMMSEGGLEGIDYMFDSLPLENKVGLDIGSGIGGVAFYLAEKFSMQITGLEVNRWMVEESKNRTPEHLKGRVDFRLSDSNTGWSIPNDSYDIIYSKGVLTHLETKDEILQECYRLLKKGGLLVITDWLSSSNKQWGGNIARLVALENLALFPESKNGYIELLEKNGFTILSVRDDSCVYHRFNQEIVKRLQNDKEHQTFLTYFDEAGLEASIEGYESIVKALEVEELKIFRFVVQKI